VGHCCGFTNIAEWYVQDESLQGDGSRARQEIPQTAGWKAQGGFCCTYEVNAVNTTIYNPQRVQWLFAMVKLVLLCWENAYKNRKNVGQKIFFLSFENLFMYTKVLVLECLMYTHIYSHKHTFHMHSHTTKTVQIHVILRVSIDNCVKNYQHPEFIKNVSANIVSANAFKLVIINNCSGTCNIHHQWKHFVETTKIPVANENRFKCIKSWPSRWYLTQSR